MPCRLSLPKLLLVAGVFLKPFPTAAQSGQEQVCAGSAIPAGWIVIDDLWNPAKCGNPSTIVYNVWVIDRLDGTPVGATKSACVAPSPPGWVVVDNTWIPTRCGHPSTLLNNVMTIKRISSLSSSGRGAYPSLERISTRSDI